MTKTKITPLYERLSRDDELSGESFSIQNQKAMLEDYARRNGFPNPTHFTDDGISGTRFDRPGFTAMMEEVEAGRVEAIIVKDMSRLGRDYLKVGQVMEILRQRGVRLHWFNPLVHFMNQEITKACEFSCDEAVLTKMGQENVQDYGNTLLNAMAAVGKYKENLGSVTLSGNKLLLKERLGAIMNFKKKSKAIRLLTGVLTLCVVLGAAHVGVYSAAAASDQTAGKPQVSGKKNSTQAGTGTYSGDYASQVKRYYEADSLPLFEITFSRLDESTQRTWLEKLYYADTTYDCDKVVDFEGITDVKDLGDNRYAFMNTYTYGFLSGNGLSAGISSNSEMGSVYSNERVKVCEETVDGTVTVGMYSNVWYYDRMVSSSDSGDISHRGKARPFLSSAF